MLLRDELLGLKRVLENSQNVPVPHLCGCVLNHYRSSCRFCCRQIFWALLRGRLCWVLGTTKEKKKYSAIRGKYFVECVLEGGLLHDGEDDEEDICLPVTQCPESVVGFLSCCVPKSQFDSPLPLWLTTSSGSPFGCPPRPARCNCQTPLGHSP